ncbi:MAG: response regulator, partial [Acidimicrobiales bacterium]|nr:response regulator [Acidimicrobiales bacterium]
MDGFELAGAIRQKEAEAGLPRTPILALSANVVQGEAERCIGAGMDDFVGKPAPMPVLAEKLQRWPHIRWAETAAPAPAGGAGAEAGPPGDE